MWRATSKAFCTLLSAKSFHPKNHGTRMRWPDEEIGRNSDRPCVNPRMIACQMGKSFSDARHDARAPGAGAVEVVADDVGVGEGGQEVGGAVEVADLHIGRP